MTAHRWPQALAQQIAQRDPVRLLYLAVLCQAAKDARKPSYCTASTADMVQQDALDYLKRCGVNYEA